VSPSSRGGEGADYAAGVRPQDAQNSQAFPSGPGAKQITIDY